LVNFSDDISPTTHYLKIEGRPDRHLTHPNKLHAGLGAWPASVVTHRI